jgi:hypothetical protein
MNRPGQPIGVYTLPVELSENEISQKKDEFFKNNLHIAREQDKLDRAKLIFKDETDIPKRENKRLMQEIKDGFVEQEIRGVEDFDFDEGVVRYYSENHDGEMICQRKMTREEKRQLKLKYEQGID